jgi:hypothetical protein
MPDRNLTYRVDVDAPTIQKSAKTVKDVFQRELSDVQIGGGAVSGKGGAAMGGGLLDAGVLNALKGGLAGIATVGFARQVGELEQLGTQVTRTREGFVLLAGGAENAAAKLEAVQRGANGTVDSLQAMNIANQAGLLGFADTAQELERVTRLATISGRLMGVDMVAQLQNMQAAAANLSFVRLDTLGINAEKVKARFAELNKTMDDTAAFTQAMLEVGEAGFKDLGDSSLVMGTALERTGAKVRNVWNQFAEGVSIFINDKIKGIPDAVDSLSALGQSIDILRQNTSELTPAQMAARDSLAELNQQLLTLQISTEDYIVQAGELIAAFNGIDTAATNALGSITALAGGARIQAISGNIAAEIGGGDQATFEGQMAALRQQTAGARQTNMAQGAQNEQIAGILQDIEDKRLDMFWKGAAENRDAARRADQKAADEAEAAWKKSAAEVEARWKAAIGSIPGLPGTGRSPVTQEQMDLAAAGIPQRFADSFLREVEDTLINGVQRPNVDIEQIRALTAQSAGLTGEQVGGLSNEQLAKMFGGEFTSGRLFALPEVQANIGQFLDEGAIEKGLQQNAAGEQGKQFVDKWLKQRFGGDYDMSFMAEGMATGLQTALQGGEGGVDFAGPTLEAVAGQFTEESLGTLSGVSKLMVDRLTLEWGNDVTSAPWAVSMMTAILNQLAGQIEALKTENGGT